MDITGKIPNKEPEPTLVVYNQPLQIESIRDQPKLAGMEALLSKLLPQRVWMERGNLLHVQYVSSTPATTAEVKLIEQRLDARLKKMGAHTVGICKVRTKLHEQCFDEIIRQVTITCAARGTLLKRVHEEIRARISKYEDLYESSNSYGVRSFLRGSNQKDIMRRRVALLEKEIQQLEGAIDREMVNREKREADFKAQSLAEDQTHEEFLKEQKNAYDELMEKYVDRVKVSFEEKKGKKGKRK
uniref:Dynein light chain n=1 Tax=Lotharella oceanica TaxID=641309 RepID=A0A7S2TNF7_9EUKA|mmetsp:Transcript_22305/g.41882  ORF Transcript_22305/g.41882 Transcript_22305/m.41882 type:complete len:243 (+) Transcript_22305:152-880(+)|eukprot:CAMPEP_0170183028 /NCGR_PEP_ID=MMETSP0040_2-20121228/29381_1 /TAXON_ID=641309 /ORGANISM="Lotharella oceanica, Strain CCMP622" /LENGTH=242 /DNA_ID=CAMNT_0010428625 /DNA_START=76 /DNA_END=804 /DNA_ORIENTATION=+